MFSRALWAVLLSLLAWIPVGRGQAWAARGDTRDRALLSVSALDIAAESPARAASGRAARFVLATEKKPESARHVAPTITADAPWSALSSSREPETAPQRPNRRRGFKADHLRFPHDAIAPPLSAQS